MIGWVLKDRRIGGDVCWVSDFGHQSSSSP